MATGPSQDKVSFLLGEHMGSGWNILLTVLAVCAVLCVTAGVLLLKLPLVFLLGVYGMVLLTAAIFKWPYLGAVCYVAVQFIRPAEVWTALAPLRLEMILVALCAVAFIINQADRKSTLRPRFHSMHLLLLLLLVAGLASVPAAFDKTNAVFGVYELVKIVAGYFVIVFMTKGEKQVRWLIVIFVICALVQWQWLFRGYFSGATWYRMGIVRAVGATETMRDPNAMGGYLLSALPFIVLVFMHLPKCIKWTLPLVLGPYLFGVSVTGSRSAYLGGMAMALAFWARSKHKVFVAIIACFAVLVLASIAGDQYHQRFMTIFKPSDTSMETGDYGSASQRIEVWRAGIRMFLDRPGTGVGAKCFPNANKAYIGYYLQPHSVYIQTASELGIGGLIGFFGMVGLIFRYSGLIRRRLKLLNMEASYLSNLTIVVDLCLFSLLFSGLFGHNMYRFTYYFLAAIVVLCWHSLDDASGDTTVSDGNPETVKQAISTRRV